MRKYGTNGWKIIIICDPIVGMINNINNNMLWKRHLSVYTGGN